MIQTLVEKISKDKIDSFWYENYVAILSAEKNGRKFLVEPHGDIEIIFKPNEDSYKNATAVAMADLMGLNDKDLNKLSEHDGWLNNNWFAIIELDKNNNVIGDDLGICHDYNEAVELFENVLKEI